MVLSIVIGVTRAGAVVLAVRTAIFPTVLATILAPVFSAIFAAILAAIFTTIFTARGFIGLASDGRCGEQGARDEQCSTQS